MRQWPLTWIPDTMTVTSASSSSSASSHAHCAGASILVAEPRHAPNLSGTVGSRPDLWMQR